MEHRNKQGVVTWHAMSKEGGPESSSVNLTTLGIGIDCP